MIHAYKIKYNNDKFVCIHKMSINYVINIKDNTIGIYKLIGPRHDKEVETATKICQKQYCAWFCFP